MASDHYIVKPLVGGLHILDALRAAAAPLSLSEATERSEMSKTTTFRYLKTLVQMGYVTQQANGTYSLGPSAFLLGDDDSREVTLRHLAEPHMLCLARTFGETINLGVPKGKSVHYIAILEPNKPLRHKAESGDADPFHSTALGKAMVAFMPKERADRHLKSSLVKFTDHTITTRRELEKALTKVRLYGYAIDREENELGCVCFAAPIFGQDDIPLAAISVSVPTARLTIELDLQISEKVREHASSISAALHQEGLSGQRRSDLRSKRGKGSLSTKGDAL